LTELLSHYIFVFFSSHSIFYFFSKYLKFWCVIFIVWIPSSSLLFLKTKNVKLTKSSTIILTFNKFISNSSRFYFFIFQDLSNIWFYFVFLFHNFFLPPCFVHILRSISRFWKSKFWNFNCMKTKTIDFFSFFF